MSRSSQQILIDALHELEQRLETLKAFEAEIVDTKAAIKVIEQALAKRSRKGQRSTSAAANANGATSPRARFKQRVRQVLQAGPLTVDELTRTLECSSQDWLYSVLRNMEGAGDLSLQGGMVQLAEMGMPEVRA